MKGRIEFRGGYSRRTKGSWQNAKIIGRALSDGIDPRDNGSGGPRGRPTLRMSWTWKTLLWKHSCAEDVARRLSRTNERRYLALGSLRILTEALVFFKGTRILSKRTLTYDVPVATSVIARGTWPICWRDVFNDAWNCLHQSAKFWAEDCLPFTSLFCPFMAVVGLREAKDWFVGWYGSWLGW